MIPRENYFPTLTSLERYMHRHCAITNLDDGMIYANSGEWYAKIGYSQKFNLYLVHYTSAIEQLDVYADYLDLSLLYDLEALAQSPRICQCSGVRPSVGGDYST